METIIQIQHLQKHFGNLKVLNDVDFDIHKGEVVTIIGSSGSGKSTMLRCVNLLERMDGGHVLYHGKDILSGQMDVNEYQKSAMTTLNPTLDRKDVLINSVMGLCGESGEAIDIVKKWLMQGHELDKEHLIKELGDVAWYLAEAATALDVPLETVFQENLDKLHRRFPNGFDTQASVHRKKDDI